MPQVPCNTKKEPELPLEYLPYSTAIPTKTAQKIPQQLFDVRINFWRLRSDLWICGEFLQSKMLRVKSQYCQHTEQVIIKRNIKHLQRLYFKYVYFILIVQPE